MQDKLFLCLWFWLVGISIVTGASLIYRCLSLGLSFFCCWSLNCHGRSMAVIWLSWSVVGTGLILHWQEALDLAYRIWKCAGNPHIVHHVYMFPRKDINQKKSKMLLFSQEKQNSFPNRACFWNCNAKPTFGTTRVFAAFGRWTLVHVGLE